MDKLQNNCNESASEMKLDPRTKPGGYITKQQIDAVNMATANIDRHLHALTGTNATKEEIYRLISLIALENGEIKTACNNLKSIFE